MKEINFAIHLRNELNSGRITLEEHNLLFKAYKDIKLNLDSKKEALTCNECHTAIDSGDYCKLCAPYMK